MSNNQPSPAPSQNLSSEAPGGQPAAIPLCLVVDEELSIRHFISLIMHGSGIDTMEFPDGRSFRSARLPRAPEMIFLNVSLDVSDAIESITALGKLRYQGRVQLMSDRGSAVLENIRSVGEQNSLSMLPVLKKPFETAAVRKIIQDLKIGMPPAGIGRVGLDDALKGRMVEFWYQPKIDLRKKQLVGAETYARVRHPQYGVLSPESFMPGADDASVLTLAEMGLSSTIKAGINFSSVGVNMRMAINVPIATLVKLPIADIVRAHRPPQSNWAGVIIDVPEEQIAGDLALAGELFAKFKEHKVTLAIDDFGRAYSSFAKLKELPFAEIKIDRAFVTDCGSDKVNAPLCKTVIDLAHNFGCAAVAIGIEKASDLMALVSMGCDIGQGYLLGQPMPEDRLMSLLRQRATGQRAAPSAAGPALEKRPA